MAIFTGPSTSYQQQEAVQFPRVLWADPSKPKIYDAIEDSRLYTVPEIPSEMDCLSVDNSRRFSSSTDTSFDSRIPSPFGAYSDSSSVNRWMTRSPQSLNAEKRLNPINRGSLPAFHSNSGYKGASRYSKSTPRKISFAVDDRVENNTPVYHKTLSTASSHNSIPESLKDVPFIDNVEESPENANENDNTKPEEPNSPFVIVDNDPLTMHKNDNSQEDSVSRKSSDSGFFNSLKKSFTNFFSGKSKTDSGNIDDVKNSDDKKQNGENVKQNSQSVDIPKEKNKIINNSNSLLRNKEEQKNVNNIVEECANDDIVILPYKENCIDIARDIEICTDFAETDALEPDLEISWNNKKLKSSYSKNRTITNEVYKPIKIS